MAQCLHPWFSKSLGIQLPCGKCYECKARRVSHWSYRLLKECDISDSAYFVTLTYNTEAVPITDKKYMTLVKADVQKFMKRLRKSQKGGKPLKYYLCGEYGGRFKRPHYHIILFNANLDSLIGKDYAKAYFKDLIPLDGKIPFECPSWTYGQVTVGQVTEASVGYTLKYISKQKQIPAHRNDDRLPEFSLMSKGMGKNYLTPAMIKWHKDDLLDRQFVNLPDGKKVSMPRYYKQKIYTEEEQALLSKHFEDKWWKEYMDEDIVQQEKRHLICKEKDRKNKDNRILNDNF